MSADSVNDVAGRARRALQAARRRWLKQAGVLVSAAAVPLRISTTAAQSQPAVNTLPRLALVIGNTRYADAPLKNPGNDAKGIASELHKLGFQVNLKLDAGRSEMIEAIRAFGAELASKKGVGMFYYAGHGAQLEWKNYLIPVDAVVASIEDMQTKTVELNSLLEGLVKAQNPMNVIILDACRDNPFGGKVRTVQKGLSQFDAPPGSLLAYATSPGNTAADGDGENGLYTENLLRELRVPAAKIEDVFKRVRLNVRRKSEGQQIPWESTSLEQDFYFVPPARPQKLTPDEAEKLFEEQLATWERVKISKDPAPLEDFIRKYPSGNFSELAQFRLDKLLAEREAKVAQAERDKQAKLAEERRIAEEKQLAEQKRLAEEKRIALEKRLVEERRLADEKKIADEKMLAVLTEEKRRAEQARLALDRKLAEERRAAEEKKLADDIRLAEEKRLAFERAAARATTEAETPVPTAPVSVAASPYTKGTARIDTRFKIGDSYTYREFDLFTKIDTGTIESRITAITDDEVIFNDGKLVTDYLGNQFRTPNGWKYTGAQFYIAEYAVGKKWVTRFKVDHGKFLSENEFEFRVVGREKITVPAGTFDAFRVEGDGWSNGTWAVGGSIKLKSTYWISPGIRRTVAGEMFKRHSSGKILNNERRELIAYSQQ